VQWPAHERRMLLVGQADDGVRAGCQAVNLCIYNVRAARRDASPYPSW
jgi:hypothetical protein